jgi:membrane protein
VWSLLKDTAAHWSKHKAAQLGAALAYYSIFSLGPLLVIAVAVAGLTFQQEAVRGEVDAELRALLGDTGAQAVNAMLLGASQPREGILATVLGLGTLVWAALGLVVQLKDALNTVWEVEPPRSSGIWDFVRTYIVSLAAVLSLGFLLLVSLLLTTALAVGGRYFAPYVSEVAMHALGSAVSFGMVTFLFAMMFKWLPDTHVAWRDVWLGYSRALRDRQGAHRPLHRQTSPRIDLWRGGLPRRSADLGILLVATRADGRGIHARLRPPTIPPHTCAFLSGAARSHEHRPLNDWKPR